MGLLGKIIAAPFRLVNVPLRLMDKTMNIMCDQPDTKENRTFGKPLTAVADTIEEAIDGDLE